MKPGRVARYLYLSRTEIRDAVTEADADFFRESRQRPIDETRARVLFHQHQWRPSEDSRCAHRRRRISAGAHDDARTKPPDQRRRQSDCADEFDRCARPLKSVMSTNSMHLE